MGWTRKREKDQEAVDDNCKDAEAGNAPKISQETNNGNNEKNDVDIILTNFEKTLEELKRILKKCKDLGDKYNWLKEENEKKNKKLGEKSDEIERLGGENRFLGDVNKCLEKENERLKRENIKNQEILEKNLRIITNLKNENEELKGKIKNLDDKNKYLKEEKVVWNNLNPDDIPKELQNDAYDHKVDGDIRGWYWIVPYEGNLRDFTQNKMEKMQVPRAKKRPIDVSVDKNKHIIYIEKNKYTHFPIKVIRPLLIALPH